MLYVLLASNNNLTDQGDETEGLEMKGLGVEVYEREDVKELYF
jgi:hypothetical protein